MALGCIFSNWLAIAVGLAVCFDLFPQKPRRVHMQLL